MRGKPRAPHNQKSRNFFRNTTMEEITETEEPSRNFKPKSIRISTKPSEMGKSTKTKILVLGPVKSGKTTISNYLADSSDTNFGYRPTKGVRIVEFESNDLELGGEKIDADVELWDCSGDDKYRHCWPAIRDKARGAILVANPDNSAGTDLLVWYEEFVVKADMRPDNVLVVLNETGDKRTNDAAISDFRLPTRMQGIQCIASSIQHDGEQLRLEFNQFLCNVISTLHENEE